MILPRVDPVRGYNFAITLADSADLLAFVLTANNMKAAGGFSECSGLETTLDTEDYKEGGNNGKVLKFPTRVTWANLRLRRGVTFNDDLWRWHYDFAIGFGRRREGVIVLQDDAHKPLRVWTFTRGLPVKWVGPSLNASQSQVAVEEIEIAHEGLAMRRVAS
jgi:phage tail-like protein